MEYIIIAVTAFIASGLTLFSGFGLGTILLPVFALFMPLEMAIATTAIVHLLNNIFKLGLLGNHINKKVAFKFGAPAVVGAIIGAFLLLKMSFFPQLGSYSLMGKEYTVKLLNIIIAVLIIISSVPDLFPTIGRVILKKEWLGVGGFLSGFFGGLSGHQGALRSAFLIKYNLSKEAFVATGVAIALFIDLARLFVYSSRYSVALLEQNANALIVAVLAAFSGAFIAKKVLKKVTLKVVQLIVGIGLIVIALLLGAGII